MPSFILTFTKTIEVSVKAESREALEAAAKAEVKDRLRAWGTGDVEAPWEVEVSQAHPSMEPGIKKWDCGVAGGRVLAYEDYLKESGVPADPSNGGPGGADGQTRMKGVTNLDGSGGEAHVR